MKLLVQDPDFSFSMELPPLGVASSSWVGGFLINLVAESPKGREVPQGEAFELGRSVPPSIKLEIN